MHTRVFSTAGFLASSTALEKIGAFLVIPALTGALTPADFGALMTALSYAGFGALLYLNGLPSALFRWYGMWREPFDRRLYEKWIFTLILGAAALLTLLFALALPFPATGALLGVDPALVLAVFAASALGVPVAVKSGVWIVEGRSERNFLVSLVSTTLFTGLVIAFAERHPTPYLRPAAQAAALLPFLIYTLWRYAARYPSLRSAPFPAETLGASLRYGWSVQASQIALLAVVSGDRILLAHLAGGEAVARYSILMLSVAPMFLLVSFNNAFSAVFNDLAAKGADAAELLRPVGQYALAGGLLLLAYRVALRRLAAPVILLVATPDYLPVAPLLHHGADLLLGYHLYLLFTRPLHASAAVRPIVTITAVAALANIALNLALIPRLGVPGALAASILSFALLAMLAAWRMVEWGGVKAARPALLRALLVLVLFFLTEML